MRVKRFEAWMKELIEAADHPEVSLVETFEEGGFTDKPCGLHVKFHSGAEVFVQFVRTAPPGGDDHSRPERIVTRPDYEVKGSDPL
jgi:hypothetical protein